MATKTDFTVNNLNSTEITLFYHFLYSFETTYKKCKANLEIISLVTEFDEYIKNNDIKLITKNLTQIQNFINTSKNEIYFTNSKTKVLSFLTHLRNSIAHCKIVENSESYIIKDYQPDGTSLTMNGCIEVKHLQALIKIFI